MQDAFQHCERLVREADRDRYIANLFAPAACRPGLFAIDAFAIEVGRVGELVSAPLPGEIRLQWWRDALAGAGHGDVAAHPVAAALLETIARYRLPVAPLQHLIDARGFDLYDEPMQTVAELEAYAAHTAAVPMQLAADVLGGGAQGDCAALIGHAGIAYGITGLLRALPRHASRRRAYVPTDLLQRHGADIEDLFAGRATPALMAALADLRALARRHFAAAAALAGAMPAALAPALMPAALVPAWLDRMERAGDPFHPPDIAEWRRQWIMWRKARRPVG
jgi:phytoene synthase